MKEWILRWNTWKTGKFSNLDHAGLKKQAESFKTTLTGFKSGVRQWKVWKSLSALVQQFQQTLPLVEQLR